MTSINDIIDGDFFQSLADCVVYEKLPSKEIVILYATTDNYQRAISYIHNNPQQKFKLITHNSDLSVHHGYVPDNLIKWYAQNLNFNHPKIEPIPIGLENQHWHPSKRSILDRKMNEKLSRRISDVALCQFNPDTFPKERWPLFSMCMNKTIAGDCYFCVNGLDFSIYAENLLNYKFALCPRGNGLDTHRMWEAMLLGCVPIVKRHKTCYNYDIELPVIFVDSWNEITEDFLRNKVDTFDFNTPVLMKSYWTERILNAAM